MTLETPASGSVLHLVCMYPILVVLAIIAAGVVYAPSEFTKFGIVANNTTENLTANCCCDDSNVCHCDYPRIVVIRDDDVKNNTPALEWMTNTITANNAKCVYAVIPDLLTESGINYLNSLDPTKFELATHGLDHTLTEDQVAIMPSAKLLMVSYFNKTPTSIAAPYEVATTEFMSEAHRQSYHSQINNNSELTSPIYTFPFDFRWEYNWNLANLPTYRTFDDFKQAFESSNKRIFIINVHHEDIYQNPIAMADFTKSLNYLNNNVSCFFMTEEQAYQTVSKGIIKQEV